MEKSNYSLSEKEQEIINEAREQEINVSSFWHYLSFCLANAGYVNAAEWSYGQSKEERLHFKKLSDYLQLRGYEPEMPEIAKPEIDFIDLKFGIDIATMKEATLAEMYEEWLDELQKLPKANMTHQVFLEMLSIQKYSIDEMRNLQLQISTRNTPEEQMEFDLQYFGQKNEVSPIA